MTNLINPYSFTATLKSPAKVDSDEPWCFIVLPKAASDILPRRGRTSINGTINGQCFTASLEPDGQKSHWLRINANLLETAKITSGDNVNVQITPVDNEPEPEVPEDLANALAINPDAENTWHNTTTLARVDWIHWITTANSQKLALNASTTLAIC